MLRARWWLGLGLAAAVAAAVAVPAAAQDGVIRTVAGTGSVGYSGDGGPAVQAEVNFPSQVVATAGGGFVFADVANHAIRRVSPLGIITTVAGNGEAGFSGDGGPAIEAQLEAPHGVAVTADGGLLISDSGNDRIRRVSPDGTITTVAGTGNRGFSGDGGPADRADLAVPWHLATTVVGGFLLADAVNNRVRRVSPDGTIETVAGTGKLGASGDGGPALDADIDANGVAVTADGGFLLTSPDRDRVRRVSARGIISTVAGSGEEGFSGDGGPATQARLRNPQGVASLRDGGFLITEQSNNRVRGVSADGIITTVAGGGPRDGLGDGGPATAATLDAPFGVTVTASGDVLIADSFHNRIRLVEGALPPDELPPEPVVPPAPPGTEHGGGHDPTLLTARLLDCLGARVALLDIRRQGRRAFLRGAVARDLIDSRVAIRVLRAGRRRVVARVLPEPDGTFETAVRAPARRFLRRARYRASVGRARSRPLKLARRAHIVDAELTGTRVRVRGQIVRPLTRPRARVIIREYGRCTPRRVVARVRVKRDGSFTARFRPRSDDVVAIYRAETRVARTARTRRRGFRTFTLPAPAWLR